MKKQILLVFSTIFFIACGGGSASSKISDSNISATTEGTWYKPKINNTWQWQLKGSINSSYNVDIYDVDLFDTSKEQIQKLHNNGKKVICYFSAGTYENWREDKDAFSSELIGKKLPQWEGENWLDISNEKLTSIMLSRLELAKDKGCDAVEPDNMDNYLQDSGFSLSFDDQLKYNKYLANTARTLGLGVGLKNDLDQIPQLVEYFDFAVNEQCFEYNECDKLKPFIDANKPVFNAEYKSEYRTNPSLICNESISLSFATLILDINLDDSFRFSCR